jgi:hypothetical protein
VSQFSGLPMSNAIAALPRTHAGMAVPYTTLYLEGDDPSALSRQNGRLFLDCRCTFGHGRPRLGQPCPQRQRRCMAERRCVTRGRRLGLNAELVFLGLTRRTTDGAVDGEFVSVEPPAHADCAAFSAFAGPHLVLHPEQVIVGVTRTYTLWHQVAPSATPRRTQRSHDAHRLAADSRPRRGDRPVRSPRHPCVGIVDHPPGPLARCHSSETLARHLRQPSHADNSNHLRLITTEPAPDPEVTHPQRHFNDGSHRVSG